MAKGLEGRSIDYIKSSVGISISLNIHRKPTTALLTATMSHYLDTYQRMHDLDLCLARHFDRPPVLFEIGSRRDPANRDQDPRNFFKPMLNAHPTNASPRWVEIDPTPGGIQHAVLVYADGAAPSNGLLNVRAGCGIVYRPDKEEEDISFPLESVGGAKLTSNRAELRAAHAALCMSDWQEEGFGKVVIACDSEYVVLGATERIARWDANGWKTAQGRDIANKDLWAMLIDAIERLEQEGTIVHFHLICRELNLADKAAKDGAVSDFTASIDDGRT